MTSGLSGDDVDGLHVLRLESRHDDAWGTPYFEQGHNIPFACKRVFYISVDRGRVERGGHANSCDELIVAITGSVLIEVDNGTQKGSVRLSSSDNAVWIRAGLLINLRDLVAPTLLMVFASQSYADTRHFDQPQPQFLRGSRFA